MELAFLTSPCKSDFWLLLLPSELPPIYHSIPDTELHRPWRDNVWKHPQPGWRSNETAYKNIVTWWAEGIVQLCNHFQDGKIILQGQPVSTLIKSGPERQSSLEEQIAELGWFFFSLVFFSFFSPKDLFLSKGVVTKWDRCWEEVKPKWWCFNQVERGWFNPLLPFLFP